MEFVVKKALKGAKAVQSHELFGKAVFLECGYHNPEKFCFDHHVLFGGEFTLSTAGMVQQQLIQRRRLPNTIVMNHVRHLDNIVGLYLLWYRRLATTADATDIVAVADLMDRVGPLAAASCPQQTLAVLNSAQSIIPFNEWELGDEEARDLALQAVTNLKNMVTTEQEPVRYETIFEESEFIVVTSKQFLGSTLYDSGYDAYAVYVRNDNGSYKWTLARASEYVPFDIPGAFAELNELEEGIGDDNSWAGRATIGGSPKKTGSRLTPEQVVEVLKKHWHG